MSKSNTDTLLTAYRDWVAIFLGTLESTTAYTQFTSKCYKELIREGMPSAEASIMATELLKIHIHQWFQMRRKDESDDINLKILQTFTSQQGQ